MKLESIFAAAAVTTLTGGVKDPTFPPPDTSQGAPVQVLVIPSTDTSTSGQFTVPAGYAYVVYEGPAQIVGADPNLVVVGDLNFTGQAASVLAGGTGGSVSDSTTNAVLDFFGPATSVVGAATVASSYTFNASGNGQQINVASDVLLTGATVSGNNSTVTIGNHDTTIPVQSGYNQLLVSGTGDVVTLNNDDSYVSVSGAATINVHATYQNPASTVATPDVFAFSAASTVNQTGGSTYMTNVSGGPLTYNGTGGTAIIFDQVGGSNITAGSGNTEFVGNPNGGAASTMTDTAGGTDTIFAGAAINYQGAGAANTFFAGGSGADSVAAGGSATVFGGTASSSYTVGGTSFLFVGNSVSTGSITDTVAQGASAASGFMWSDTNEQLSVTTLTGATATNDTLIAFGSNDTVNAMNSAGHNDISDYNQKFANGSEFTGNTTLIGSNAGNDLFSLFVDSSTTAAHTVTIENWQASDTLFVNNLSSSGDHLSAADSSAIANFLAGSSNQFTLQDGTTVVFADGKPTQIAHL